MKHVLCLVLGSLLISASVGWAVVVGTAEFNGGNTAPFGRSSGDTEYQQIYSASAFPGAMDIGEMSFFAETRSIGRSIDNAIYTISLSTTGTPIGGLSTNLSSNIGPDNAAFGAFHLSGPLPSRLDFFGGPFSYDPSMGNLLMDIQITLISVGSAPTPFFQADNSGLLMGRAYNTTQAGPFVDAVGLVTEFQVPEPSCALVILLGLAMSDRLHGARSCRRLTPARRSLPRGR